MNVKIYHNPRCSKSRDALKLLQAQGIQPEIIEYLKTPLSIAELKTLLQKLALQPREAMRTKEAEYKDNILDDIDLSEDVLIDALHRIPKLLERPIVVVDEKAVIARPAEKLLALL
jgi:arsenate reductase